MANGGKILNSLFFFFMLFLSVAYASSTTILAFGNGNHTSVKNETKSGNSSTSVLLASFGGSLISIAVTGIVSIPFIMKVDCLKGIHQQNHLNFAAYGRNIFDFVFIVVLRYLFQKFTDHISKNGDFPLLLLLPFVGLQIAIHILVALWLRKGYLDFFAIFSTGMANVLLFAQNWKEGVYVICLCSGYAVVAIVVGLLLWIYPAFAISAH